MTQKAKLQKDLHSSFESLVFSIVILSILFLGFLLRDVLMISLLIQVTMAILGVIFTALGVSGALLLYETLTGIIALLPNGEVASENLPFDNSNDDTLPE